MNPTKNNPEPTEPQKVVVEKRGMLPQKSVKSGDKEKPIAGGDLQDGEEKQPLADHKLKLTPNKNAPTVKAAPAVAKVKPELETDEATSPDSSKKASTKAAPPKPDPEEAAKKEAIQKLIEDKKYAVPITHNKSHRSTRQFAITFVLVLVVGLLAIDLLIDAGIIKSGIKPPINLINN